MGPAGLVAVRNAMCFANNSGHTLGRPFGLSTTRLLIVDETLRLFLPAMSGRAGFSATAG